MLSQGEVDLSATPVMLQYAVPASNTVSDAEAEELLDIETEVGIIVVDKNKTRAGVAFFKHLNSTLFNLENMVYLILTEATIHITVCI